MFTKYAAFVLPIVVLLGALGSAQQPAGQAPETPEDRKARDVFIRVCTKCHPAERATAEGRTRAQWGSDDHFDADRSRCGDHARRIRTSCSTICRSTSAGSR
jgi:hypothetical protein